MAHDFTAPIPVPSDLVDRCLAWATRVADEHGMPVEASDWWLAAKEIERLRAALRKIETLPRDQYVMQGPALPASIARRALADQ